MDFFPIQQIGAVVDYLRDSNASSEPDPNRPEDLRKVLNMWELAQSSVSLQVLNVLGYPYQKTAEYLSLLESVGTQPSRFDSFEVCLAQSTRAIRKDAWELSLHAPFTNSEQVPGKLTVSRFPNLCEVRLRLRTPKSDQSEYKFGYTDFHLVMLDEHATLYDVVELATRRSAMRFRYLPSGPNLCDPLDPSCHLPRAEMSFTVTNGLLRIELLDYTYMNYLKLNILEELTKYGYSECWGRISNVKAVLVPTLSTVELYG